jgi:glycosyltransferase involved in cell wall biosynthesis
VKILIVGPSNSPHCVRWINRLLENELEVILLDMAPQKNPGLDQETRVLRLSDLTPSYDRIGKLIKRIKFLAPMVEWLPILFLSKSIKKLALEEQIDLVHIHWMLHPLAVAAAIQSAAPIIATPWGSDVLLPHYQSKSPIDVARKIYARAMIRVVVSKSSQFICDASHLRKALVELGAKTSQISEIYFGTDIENFSPKLRKTDLVEVVKNSSKGIVILSNRGLDEIYEIWVLLEAIPFLLDKIGDLPITIWIAGGGKDQTKLERISQSLNLDSHVRFLGRLSDLDFASLTASCDIYVSTSPTDGGLAASVAEAMACEKPVVISNFGDNSLWLNDESAGLLFEKSNPQDLATKLAWLIQNPNLWKEMGRIGREIIANRNNSYKEVRKVISIYELCVQNFKK